MWQFPAHSQVWLVELVGLVVVWYGLEFRLPRKAVELHKFGMWIWIAWK